MPAASLVGDLPESPAAICSCRAASKRCSRCSPFRRRSGSLRSDAVLRACRSARRNSNSPKGFAAQAVVAFENAWAFREALEKKQMEKELGRGEHPGGLFPSSPPKLPDVRRREDKAGASGRRRLLRRDPSRCAGRRALHLLRRRRHRQGAARVADHEQHAGEPARAGHDGVDAPQAGVQINDLLYATTPGNRFVTALLVLIDGHTGQCRLVNAGHNEALHVKADGQADAFNATGMALGLFSGRRLRRADADDGAWRSARALFRRRHRSAQHR